MQEREKRWVKVACYTALEENTLTPAQVGDRALVLLRTGENVRAFDGKCPHKGAPMAEGVICTMANATQVIVCPWHKAMFSAESGRRIEPPALDPLAQYDVERRGDDLYVADQPRPLRKPTTMRHHETVGIAGAGAAAVAASETLRESGFGGRIIMVSPEKDAPYDRTALSKVALSKSSHQIKPAPLRDPGWYEANNITLLRTRVMRFDFDSRCFYLENGDSITADHALLATGSQANRPDIPGSDLEGVKTLRSAGDAREIAALISPESAVIIIGSGFIGMEAAASLRKRGVGVTVVSRSEYPFQKQFGPEIASRMRLLHERNGTAFLGKRAATKIGGEGRVEWVELDDGSRLNAALVLVGIGASPALDYLIDFPRNQNNGGLDVDERMGLGNDVFAAGDIASVPVGDMRYRIEHWRSAQAQGQIAARAMLGLPVSPLSTPWFWTQQYDQKLEWVGWPGDAFDDVLIDGDVSAFDFIARLQKNGKTVGVVGSGRAREMGRYTVRFEEA